MHIDLVFSLYINLQEKNPFHSVIHSLIQIFAKHLMYARYYSRHWGFQSVNETNKTHYRYVPYILQGQGDIEKQIMTQYLRCQHVMEKIKAGLREQGVGRTALPS